MTLIIKAILAILFVLIFFALGSALFFLVRDKDKSNRSVKALTWRIGLSILLMLILMLAFAMGWIQPHSI